MAPIFTEIKSCCAVPPDDLALEQHGNLVSNLAPLAGLPSLRRLRLRGNEVVDTAPLATLEKLITADLRNNPLSAESIALLEEIKAGSNTRITF